MAITRRQFIKGAAATGVALGLPLKFGVRSANAYAISPGLKKFIDPLPQFAQTSRFANPVLGVYKGVDYYELTGSMFRFPVSSDMVRIFPGYTGTRMYGYRNTAQPASAHVPLGGLIAVQAGKPVRMRFTNNLPAQHIIPFDATIAQGPAGTIPTQDRMAIHLHGGLVPWTSDGGPFNWFGRGTDTSGTTPNGTYGSSWVNWLPDQNGVKTNDIYYPNNQSARLMWYHDHV